MSASDKDQDPPQFATAVADRLAQLPCVHAVALGGSRAQGTATPDSDWDFAIYYRGQFDPEHLRAVGWEGRVSEIGEWGGGVFNGGAWLRVDGRPVDVHYRDLNRVEDEIANAEAGAFSIEPLMFHLAGIPTYLLLAELALNEVLVGDLPRPEYPEALQRRASAVWMDRARAHLDYAERNHARLGNMLQCLALSTVALTEAAHGILAARGMWATNDKHLLGLAGLSTDVTALGAMTPNRDQLQALVEHVRQVIAGRTAA